MDLCKICLFTLFVCLLTYYSVKASRPELDDLRYNVVLPSSVKPKQDILAYIDLEESVSPVVFGFSFRGKHSEFLDSPNQKIILLPRKTHWITFEAEKDKLINMSQPYPVESYRYDFYLDLSVSIPGKENITRQHRQYVFMHEFKPAVTINVELDKPSYTSVMDVNYRILVSDDQSRLIVRPLNLTYGILTETESSLLVTELENSGKSIQMETGYIDIHDKITYEGLDSRAVGVVVHGTGIHEQKQVSISTKDLTSSSCERDYEFKAYLEFNRYVVLPNETDTTLKVSLFEYPKKTPVAGSCEIVFQSSARDHLICEDRPETELVKTLILDSENGTATMNWDLALDTNFGKKLQENLKKKGRAHFCAEAKCIESRTDTTVLTREKFTHVLTVVNSIYKLNYLSIEIRPQDEDGWTNVALIMQVEREDEKKLDLKDLENKLQIFMKVSESTRSKLKYPNKLNYSLPITKAGIGLLELEILQNYEFRNGDSLVVSFQNSETWFDLVNIPQSSSWADRRIEISLVDPNAPVRTGEITKFHLKSVLRPPRVCFLTAVLVHQEIIMKTQKIIFETQQSESEELNETLSYEIPANISGGNVYLKVFGTHKQGFGDSYSSCDFSGRISFKVAGLFSLKITETVHNNQNSSTSVTFTVSGNFQNVLSVAGTLRGLIFQEKEFNLDPVVVISDHHVSFAGHRPLYQDPNENPREFMHFSGSEAKNGILTWTKEFDHFSQSGKYDLNMFVVSEDGTYIDTNKVRFTIPRPNLMVHLGFVPYSIYLGETVQVQATVKNKLETMYEGYITLVWSMNNNTKVDNHQSQLIKINGKSTKNYPFYLKPQNIGNLSVLLKADEFLRVTDFANIHVLPHGRLLKYTRSLLLPLLNEPGNHSKAFDKKTQQVHSKNCHLFQTKTFTVALPSYKDLYQAVSHKKCDVPLSFVASESHYQLYGNKEYPSRPSFKIIKNAVKETIVKFNFTNKRNRSFKDFQKSVFFADCNENEIEEKKLIHTFSVLDEFLHFMKSIKGSLSDENFDFESFFQVSLEWKNDTDSLFLLNNNLLSIESISSYFDNVLSTKLNITKISGEPQLCSNESLCIDSKLLAYVTKVLIEVGHNKTEDYFTLLKYRFSEDFTGKFLTSKWTTQHTCQGQTSPQVSSVASTALALSVYAKLEPNGMENIAKWLVFNHDFEQYESMTEEILAARSLDQFSKYFRSVYGKDPLLLQNTHEYLCTIEEDVREIDFTIKKHVTKDNGMLRLEICPLKRNQSDIFLEINFPSGYILGEISNEELFEPSELQRTYISKRYTHIFDIPDLESFQISNCWWVTAFRMGNVFYDDTNKKLFGWVVIHSSTNYKKKSLKVLVID